MKTYFLEVEPSAMQVSFEAENSKVYEVRLDGLKIWAVRVCERYGGAGAGEYC